METDVTRIWQDILSYNKIMYSPGKGLKLVNLTTGDVVATGNSPSKLLDKYFCEQVDNANKEYFQKEV